MRDNKIRELKRSQKESLLRKEFSKLFLTIKQEDSRFEDIFIHKIKLSSDKSHIHVFFYTHKGADYFKTIFSHLILYKPSMRKALSQIIKSRYTPEIVFKYDTTFEKQCKIEQLLNKIKEEDQL